MSGREGDFEGFVDRIETEWVIGWAWRRGAGRDRIDVELIIDGTPVNKVTADLYRADLERAGKGDGGHGFEIVVPLELRDGHSHDVRVVFSGTQTDLAQSPARARLGSHIERRTVPATNSDRGGTYHSRFGGLWTDLPSAKDVVDGKRALGWISEAEAALLRAWVDRGFVVLPQAVPLAVIDELDAEVERIWDGTSPRRCFVETWHDGHRTTQPAGPRFRQQRVKLLDLYAHFDCARRIVFAPSILRFLTLVFERPLVAFQSLYFRWGSRQDIHQDSAFVRVSSPLEFAASWVALEDVQPDSGELEYYVGSHRLDDYLFEGTRKWMPFRSSEYDAFIASLHARSQEMRLERQRFLPRKGDVLIWTADLAHGGSQEVVEGVTRKSLVTHYCPSNCEPVYTDPGSKYRRETFNEIASYTFHPRE